MIFRMPKGSKKTKKPEVDMANIEIDMDNSLIKGLKDIDELVSLKESEIGKEKIVETPEVSKISVELIVGCFDKSIFY